MDRTKERHNEREKERHVETHELFKGREKEKTKINRKKETTNIGASVNEYEPFLKPIMRALSLQLARGCATQEPAFSAVQTSFKSVSMRAFCLQLGPPPPQPVAFLSRTSLLHSIEVLFETHASILFANGRAAPPQPLRLFKPFKPLQCM